MSDLSNDGNIIDQENQELRIEEKEPQLINSISLSSIFNEAIEPHLLISLDGQVLDINPAGCLYFGIQQDRRTEFSIYDLLLHKDTEVVRHVLGGVAETGAGVLDVQFKIEGIGILTCEMVYQPVESALGCIVYARILDLQVVRILNRLLEEKEKSFKGAERLANLGSWEYYPAEDFISWSDETYNIFGLPVTSKAPSIEEYMSYVHPDDVERLGEVIQNSITKGESYFIKHKIVRADGNLRWVYGRGDVLLDEEGNLEKIYGTVQDITEEEEIRESMRKSEQRIRFHIDRSPLGYIEWNPSFDVVEWNEAAERIFGFSKEEALDGQAIIIPDDEAELVNQLVTDLLSDQGGTHSVNTNLTKSGERITVEWFNTTLRGENGEIIGIGSIVQDITQRITAKNQLENYAKDLEVAKDEAESAARAKSEFLANMSHEIRTPMNGVIGMASLLFDTELDEEQLDYVETIVNSGESLLAIINDILNLSKIEAGKVELESMPFNIREVLEDTSDLLAAKAAEKQLELVLFVAPDVPGNIIADPTRVQQVLLNLMGNAIKFTHTGYIEVSLEADPIDASTSMLTFHVTDTGIGIEKDKQDRLFNAFTQVDASTTRKYGGTGLGLTISSQLAQMMGGQITFNSTKGVGSTFSFTFFAAHGELEDTSSFDLDGLNVLFAEPNMKMQQMVGSFLDELNCRWTTVTSKEGVNRVLQHDSEIDVLLLESQLEDGSGIELAEQLSEMQEETPPVILLTWIVDREDHEGVETRLSKPVHLKSLYRTLKKVRILQK